MGKLVTLVNPFEGIAMVEFLDYAKAAEGVSVVYSAKTHNTALKFYGPNVKDSPLFGVHGNPYNQAPGERVDYPMHFEASGSLASGAADHAKAMITGFSLGYPDSQGHVVGNYLAENLPPVSAQEFLDILTTLPTDESYRRFVGLFDDDTKAIGTKFADYLETGAGDDTVKGNGGNDIVNKWDSGNLDYSGGDGFDTLSFSTSHGAYFVNPMSQALVVDLKSGTGRNPYGGTLKLDSVEKVIGTDAADKIYGSEKADWIETQDYGADLVKARGGNDRVVLWAFVVGANLDGGSGRDTLQTSISSGQNTLDLVDPSNDTGRFADNTVKGFEVFTINTSFYDDSTTTLTFRSGAGSQALTISGRSATFIDVGDGNNTATGGNGKDTITAGSGKDRLDGGGNDDMLTGGGNADLFVFGFGHGKDVIKDFVATGKDHDKIDLSAITEIKNWSDLKAHHLSSADGNPMIETGEDSSIILTAVKVKDLDADDFVFG